MVNISTAIASIFVLATSVFAAPTGPFTGAATWSYQGLYECGQVPHDNDLVVRVSQQFFESWPGWNFNKNAICGHKIRATYKGNSVTATIVGSDPGVPLYNLDFSPAAFDQLAGRDPGTLQGVVWWVL